MYNNSNLIDWSKTLTCGIKVIDEQHKGLVDLVNEMFNHVTGDEDQERKYLNRVIDEAVNYIKVHFATEEKIMNSSKFSGYIEHKEEHKKFILTVAEHIEYFNTGKRVSLMSFSKFLKEWVLSHIAIVDRKYFTHFKEVATRKADGSLSISLSDGEEVLYSSANPGGI
ncbi:MAG: bacteriohemerythrin [Treponema sp.]|nr:bacteriohemerythrin [Treponema sp.]